MDTESHLRRIEAGVHQTRMLVWAVLVILVALGLVVLRIIDLGEGIASILVILALFAVAHLLMSFGSGLWRFWTHRGVDAELQERILKGYVAERAKARGRGNPLSGDGR
jgi:hypothetical protein